MAAREASISLDELDARSENRWTVWGPNSGGVQVVFFCHGRLYTYYGGDARPAGSGGITEETIDEYAPSGDREVVTWLREKGHWPREIT